MGISIDKQKKYDAKDLYLCTLSGLHRVPDKDFFGRPQCIWRETSFNETKVLYKKSASEDIYVNPFTEEEYTTKQNLGSENFYICCTVVTPLSMVHSYDMVLDLIDIARLNEVHQMQHIHYLKDNYIYTL